MCLLQRGRCVCFFFVGLSLPSKILMKPIVTLSPGISEPSGFGKFLCRLARKYFASSVEHPEDTLMWVIGIVNHR